MYYGNKYFFNFTSNLQTFYPRSRCMRSRQPWTSCRLHTRCTRSLLILLNTVRPDSLCRLQLVNSNNTTHMHLIHNNYYTYRVHKHTELHMDSPVTSELIEHIVQGNPGSSYRSNQLSRPSHNFHIWSTDPPGTAHLRAKHTPTQTERAKAA